MAITVYPVKIEAYDEINEPVFKLESVDECCASIEISMVITPGESLEELFEAIREGLALMKFGDK